MTGSLTHWLTFSLTHLTASLTHSLSQQSLPHSLITPCLTHSSNSASLTHSLLQEKKKARRKLLQAEAQAAAAEAAVGEAEDASEAQQDFERLLSSMLEDPEMAKMRGGGNGGSYTR